MPPQNIIKTLHITSQHNKPHYLISRAILPIIKANDYVTKICSIRAKKKRICFIQTYELIQTSTVHRRKKHHQSQIVCSISWHHQSIQGITLASSTKKRKVPLSEFQILLCICLRLYLHRKILYLLG
jgi:hypothetical protein